MWVIRNQAIDPAAVLWEHMEVEKLHILLPKGKVMWLDRIPPQCPPVAG